MSGKAFVALAVAISFSMLAIVSAVAADDNRGDRGGRETGVLPCSLDGINPVYHPEIFGNAAAAASMASSDRLMGLGRCGPVAGADGVMPTTRYRGPPMSLGNMRQQGVRRCGSSVISAGGRHQHGDVQAFPPALSGFAWALRRMVARAHLRNFKPKAARPGG